MFAGGVVTAVGTEVGTFPKRWRRKTWSINQRSLEEAPCFCSSALVDTLDMIRCEESLDGEKQSQGTENHPTPTLQESGGKDSVATRMTLFP